MPRFRTRHTRCRARIDRANAERRAHVIGARLHTEGSRRLYYARVTHPRIGRRRRMRVSMKTCRFHSPRGEPSLDGSANASIRNSQQDRTHFTANPLPRFDTGHTDDSCSRLRARPPDSASVASGAAMSHPAKRGRIKTDRVVLGVGVSICKRDRYRRSDNRSRYRYGLSPVTILRRIIDRNTDEILLKMFGLYNTN